MQLLEQGFNLLCDEGFFGKKGLVFDARPFFLAKTFVCVDWMLLPKFMRAVDTDRYA